MVLGVLRVLVLRVLRVLRCCADQDQRLEFLGDAVLGDLEIRQAEVGDERAVLPDRAHVHFDHLRARTERLCRRGGRRLLLRTAKQ